LAKILKLPGLAIINGFKGQLDFYVWKGITCVRSWPRSPGHDRSPAVEAQWPAFTYATSNWTNPAPEIKQAFNDMAATIPYTGKDLFVKSYLSNYHIEITLQEG